MKARKAQRRLKARQKDSTGGALVEKGRNYHRPGSLSK